MYTTLINSAALHAYREQAGARCVVLDCRFSLSDPAAGLGAYRQGHIPGALYAHLEQDLSAPTGPGLGRHPLPPLPRFVATVARFGIDPECQVVAYDDCGGVYAGRLWWLLRWLGHDAVAVLDGGLRAWREAGLPLTADEPASRPASYRAPMPRHDLWVDTPFIEDQVVRQGQWLLLDARGAARFEGREEPIDRVGGHIPGAINLPFKGNLDAQERFLPRARLQERFAAVCADRDPARIIHMCGSGVSACHNVLAMKIAGFPDGRLYVGSWSAWISDPGRPIARA